MLTVPLSVYPAQTVGFTIGDNSFSVTIKTGTAAFTTSEVTEFCYITIVRNGEELVSNFRCVPNVLLLPWQYMEADGGNFAWVSENDEYPHFLNFGSTCQLVYLTQDEADQVRAM